MALPRRTISSLISFFFNDTPRFPLPKTIRSYAQGNSSSNTIVNAISDSFKEDHDWDTLTRKFSSLQLEHSLVEQVLLRLKEPPHARSALNFFYWSSKTKNFQHQIYSYCIVIHILVGAQQLTEAKILIDSFLKRYATDSPRFSIVESVLGSYKIVASSPLVFDLLVQGYAKLRMFEDCFEVCCYLEESGLCPSLISYNALLHVAQKAGVHGLVWRIYEHMIDNRKFPNEVTLRTMIAALCKEGKLQMFVDLLDRIHGKRCSPTILVNASLVFRVVKEGRIEDGMALLKRMLQKSLILDTVAYSLIVYAKVELEDLESAWEVYEEMLKRGFSANSFVYTSFIGGFCRESRIEEANNLFQEMQDTGLKPYDETFNLLIKGCVKVGDMKGSASYCEEMIRRGLVPSCCSFNEMIRGLCEMGDSKKANALLTLVLEKGFLPNETTYSHLIAGYGKEGDIQEVYKLYYEMECTSLSPGLPVFASLIRSLCRCGKLEDAEKYLRIMKERFLTPNEDIYEALISSHFEKGDRTRATSLCNEMAAKGLKAGSLFFL